MGNLCSKDTNETPVTTQGRRARYEAEKREERHDHNSDIGGKNGSAHSSKLPPAAAAKRPPPPPKASKAPPAAGAPAAPVEKSAPQPVTSAPESAGGGVSTPKFLPPELLSADFAQCAGPFRHGDQALCVADVGDGQFVTGGEDGSLHCLSIGDGRIVRSWTKAHAKDINRVTPPHPTTKLFFTCSRDTTIKAWNLSTTEAKAVSQFTGHTLNVTSVTADPAGHRIVSGSRDNSVRLWDVDTAQCLSVQDIKLNIVHFTRWIPALDLIAQGGEDLTVRLWDAREKDGTALTLVDTLANFDYHPICSALVGDPVSSVSLFTGHNGFNGQGAMITEWDLRMKKQVRHLFGHRGTVRWLRAVTGKEKLLSCSDDGSVRLWNLRDGSLDADIRFPEGAVTCCDEVGDGKYAFSCRTGVVVVASISEFGDQLIRHRYFGTPGES